MPFQVIPQKMIVILGIMLDMTSILKHERNIIRAQAKGDPDTNINELIKELQELPEDIRERYMLFSLSLIDWKELTGISKEIS